jgi:signal transduction histidine kinase
MTRILVIEDESLLCAEVSDWLTFEGYDVQGATDGAAGVEMAFQFLPDLIICDITMPKLDGYGVLLELHSNPITASIPFIFVTARAAHEDIRKGMTAGADDYITKPFTRLELLQAVESRLQKKLAQRHEVEEKVNALQQALAQEREQRLLKAKLVAMFSHDFRNPLTSILSSNSLLRDYADQMDEGRRLTHLGRIDASGRQLIQMLDDMLLVMEMDTGNLNFKPVSMNPEQLFQRILEEFQAIYGETHQITFESSFHTDATADVRLLRAIAVNLLSNAIKYSPQGSEVRLTLSYSDDQFVISVQDQGIGIPKEDQKKMFSAFQRASNVGDIRGTGLGLAIVKQGTDLHNGSVYLESQEGVGTTIIVTIPIRQST